MTKRAFDIVASFLGGLVLLPGLVLVAFLIKVFSPGPVFFRQIRVGRDGREFRILKFRTMTVDAPAKGAQITVAGDPRITRLGHVLRRYKIDELPQLWNVLVGDMSLVGPRPEVPRYVAMYTEEQRRVLSVRPGITDYASITYFDENSALARSADPEHAYVHEVMPRKLRMNMVYVHRHGLFEDLRIILATLFLSVRGLVERAGRVGQFALDALVVSASISAAYMIRFEANIPDQYWKQLVLLLPYTVLARLGMNVVFGVYRIMWRYISFYEVGRFARSVAVVTSVFLLFRLFYPTTNPYFRLPISVIVLEGLFSFLGMAGMRMLRRWLHETTAAASGVVSPEPLEKSSVLVIGAGNIGHSIAREIRVHPELGMTLTGFVDDDHTKVKSELGGVPVLGRIDEIPALHRKYGFSQALLAIHDISLQRKREIVDLCTGIGIKVLIVPGASEIITGMTQVSAMRDVAIEDLLGRPVTDLTHDDPLLQPVYGGKRILITGAGGSIGSELCRQLATIGPAELVLVDKDENNIFHIRGELAWRHPGLAVSAHILDVRIREKLDRVFREKRPHVVLHAAAYKHVPLMEENPCEAVENNVLGSRNVIEASVAFGAETFVMLSTDKAVNPTSVMGATKRIAELIVRLTAARDGGTRCASVRFGNVLGSRGSVIPTFREQIARGGPVTVTHPEVVRYFMTIPEASQLVLKAGTQASSGEVFVLDMGQPIRISDLARDMIRLSGFREGDIPIRFTGLRPGEKLFEELLLDRDSVLPTPIEKVFVSKPELRDFDAFLRQVEALVAMARELDGRGIRAALESMDIGLRPCDTGGDSASMRV